MFTGIIEGVGTIKAVKPSQAGRQLVIQAGFSLAGTKIGDSIAVNGACLTAVQIDGRSFAVDVSPETVAKTTLGASKSGDRVNLERALRLGDRLDGHLVSGHIDGVGRIVKVTRHDNAIIVAIEVPQDLSRYLIKKGSVAVDGTSLTVNSVDGPRFAVSIIPHTADLATIGSRAVGSRVNIETDMIGKYVERFVAPFKGDAAKGATAGSSVDMEMLIRTGFIK